MLTSVSSSLQIAGFITAVVVFAVSLAAFLTHTVYLLSEVVILYFQVSIFLLTAASGTFMYMQGIQGDNTVLKYILVSISIMSWAMSMLAFMIAAVAYIGMKSCKQGIIRRYDLDDGI